MNYVNFKIDDTIYLYYQKTLVMAPFPYWYRTDQKMRTPEGNRISYAWINSEIPYNIILKTNEI